MKAYAVYILTNWNHKLLYIGMTDDLNRRVAEHKNKIFPGFTATYNINKLIYSEQFDNSEDAVARERQLKGWKRERKNALIETTNPLWNELREFTIKPAQYANQLDYSAPSKRKILRFAQDKEK